MCAHLAISAASEATGAMSGVCAVAVGALAGLIGLKVSFAAPPRAPKKRQPRNGVTERERPRCFCEPLGAEPMSIRSRLPRASVAKGPPGISFHSSEAADHLNCTRVSTGHWCGTGLKKAHLTVRVSLARLFFAVKPPPPQPAQGRTHFPPFKGGFEVDETSSPPNNEKRKKRRGTGRKRRLDVGHTMAALQTRSGSCQ